MLNNPKSNFDENNISAAISWPAKTVQKDALAACGQNLISRLACIAAHSLLSFLLGAVKFLC